PRQGSGSSLKMAARQQVLILCLASPDLASQVVAWSLYDGAGSATSMSGSRDTPPYSSVLSAMQDGWRVIQLPQPQPSTPGLEHQPSFLKWEFALERTVEVT